MIRTPIKPSRSTSRTQSTQEEVPTEADSPIEDHAMEEDEDETIIECTIEENRSSRNQMRTPASGSSKDQRITKNEWLEFEKNLPEIVIDSLGLSSYKQAYLKAMEIIQTLDQVINAKTYTVLASQRECMKKIVRKGRALEQEVAEAGLDEEPMRMNSTSIRVEDPAKDTYTEILTMIESLKDDVSSLKKDILPGNPAPSLDIPTTKSYASVVGNPSRINLSKPAYPQFGPSGTNDKATFAQTKSGSYTITVKMDQEDGDVRKEINKAGIFTKRTKITPKAIYNLGRKRNLVKIHLESENDQDTVAKELESLKNLSVRVQRKRNC